MKIYEQGVNTASATIRAVTNRKCYTRGNPGSSHMVFIYTPI